MPAFEVDTRYRLRTVIVWPAAGYDPANGSEILVSAARVNVSARWIDKPKRVLDSQGNTIVYDAQAVCGPEPCWAVGAVVWRGPEPTGQALLPTDPAPTTSLPYYVVKEFQLTQDVKYRNTRRVALLMRYRDTLPRTV